ncbi:MAG: hypothetical protein CVU57_20405 [Deltaproteobacteria bacterium HGW-Deltaproteobacteria-15]|nr:MAG: hypothetical protein CVU57_20405 [Deltaproteobacteria bacterium HGW-Deltaproteobacteria-15]
MEEKAKREVQDLFEGKLSRMGSKLKTLGLLIQGEAESSMVLNESERFGLGWMIEDMGKEIESLSDRGTNLCLGKGGQQEVQS